ncbi:MAG: D-alanyl-D-alanine carboxypeptidase family protein [Rhodothalassiaceae bacterium]
MTKIKQFLAAGLLLLSWPSAAAAQAVETTARHALLLEVATGSVLYEKAADERFPPASMAKMMTVYIAFEQIAKGSLAFTDRTKVSREAWRRWAGSEGSLMFLSAGEEVTVEQLLRGIVVSSGNDACTVLAEMLSGTEDAFALWMNEKAAELGMTNSRFQNASGWPAEDQYTTAHDLAVLALRTIRDFPDLYPFYAERSFTHGVEMGSGRPITQSNRNPLLGRVEGADGLKTGHTEASGFGLVGSAIRDGRRLIVVVSGLESMAARARESQALLEYGFRAFDSYRLFRAGQVVGEADTWLAKSAKLPLVVEQDVVLTLSRRDRAGLKMVLSYDNPVPAPVAKGQPVASILISAPSIGERRIPVTAGTDIARVGGFGKIGAAIEYLLFGASGSE